MRAAAIAYLVVALMSVAAAYEQILIDGIFRLLSIACSVYTLYNRKI